jgi:hypothetical protein
MESGEYQLTADGLPEYLQRVRQLSQDYDLLSTADQFKKCLKK